MGKPIKTNEFIERAKRIHGDKFGYEKLIYTGSDCFVKIYCNKCKKYFKQRANDHLKGHGCRFCGGTNKMTTNEFIKKAKKKHKNKYDYSKVDYKLSRDKVTIICIKHGEFKITAGKHLYGQGCILCKNEETSKRTRLGIKKFIEKANEKHDFKYDYSKVKYITIHIDVIITHKRCGKTFITSPYNHLWGNKGMGSECPFCNNSKGETKIMNILDKYNIQYVLQKRFSECRNKNPLPFDFYLPDYNMCIEFQGRQHYDPVIYLIRKKFSKEQSIENLKYVQKNDKIKKDYCLKNNIQLIEIPYWDIKKIEEYIVNINTSNTIEVK